MNQLLPPGGEKENYNVIIVDMIFYIFFFIAQFRLHSTSIESGYR